MGSFTCDLRPACGVSKLPPTVAHNVARARVLADHDDVIPMFRLDLCELGTARGARLQRKCHLLELGVKAPLTLPAQRAA